MSVAGLDEVRGPGLSDLWLTLKTASQVIAGGGSALISLATKEPGIYEVRGFARTVVQPALRTFDFWLRRGTLTLPLEEWVLGGSTAAGNNWYRTDAWLLYLTIDDRVELQTSTGAVGDSGLIRVALKRVGR